MDNLDVTLDLMADKLIAQDEIAFLDLVQFVWRRGWSLKSAAAPTDESELKQALKACLIERMVDIWNAPPKNANETIPDWCTNIPKLKQPYSVIAADQQHLWEGEQGNEYFSKRNIFAPQEFMFFL